MTSKGLTTAIIRLAVAWREGDRESGEMQFFSVMRFVRVTPNGVTVGCDDRAAADALTAAYTRVCRNRPGKFGSRQAFLSAYGQAMTYWLGEHLRRVRAGRRRALRPGTGFGRGAQRGSPVAEPAIELGNAIDRLRVHRLIDRDDAELYFCNRVLGVPQVDLADLYSLSRQTIAEHVRRVAVLLGDGGQTYPFGIFARVKSGDNAFVEKIRNRQT